MFDELFLIIFHDNIFFVGVCAFLLVLTAITFIIKGHYLNGVGTIIALVIAGVLVYYWNCKIIKKEEINPGVENSNQINVTPY